MNIFRLASLATVLSILLVSAARADHRAPLPATIEERVCTLVADLDDVIADFQFTEGETPTFGDDRLNRALVRARQNVVTARMEISFGNLTRGLRSRLFFGFWTGWSDEAANSASPIPRASGCWLA